MENHHRMMIEFLRDASDTEWLYYAVASNYDDNGEVIAWMVDQKNCPDSTALALYWYLQPGFYDRYDSEDQIPDWSKENYKLISKIQKRFSTNDFKRSDIGFDPTNDPSPVGDKRAKGYDWTIEYPDAKNIPEHMRKRVPGILIDKGDMPEGWDEGMPPSVVAAYWADGEEQS